ncbi:putative multidrug export ATP-binding/permease protein [Lachnospiraceae bacterium]|nr:putative multidrug export ATP-binding/permease protein [Lachnospiraceae bacterium]
MKKIKLIIGIPFRKYVIKQLTCLTFMLIYTILTLIFPGFISLVIDKGVLTGNLYEIFKNIGIMFLVGILMVAFQYIQNISFYKLAQTIIMELKNRLYEKILITNYKFWEKYSVGDILTIMETDVNRLEILLTNTVSEIFVNILIVIGISIYLIIIEWTMGVCIIILAVVFAWIQQKLGAKVESGMVRLRNNIGELAAFTNETINNVSNIQMIGYYENIKQNYKNKNSNVVLNSLNQLRTISLSRIIGMGFNVIGIIIVILVGAYKVINGNMSIGLLFSLTVYVQRLYSPIINIGSSYINIKNTMPIINRIVSVLQSDDYIHDGTLQNIQKNNFDINHVSFSYKTKEILNDFCLQIKSGDIVGIVGKNGSGKSTIIKLISGFCEPNKGEILYSGTNIRHYSLCFIRSQFGVMLQKQFFLSGSLRDIINSYRNSIDDNQIYELADLFNLDISKFENGLDTLIKENASNLSGGEAQKISLIHLFLYDKPVYILDEPTSAIDQESEEKICNSLIKLLKGKTAIIISHKRDILKICNKVIDFEGEERYEEVNN